MYDDLMSRLKNLSCIEIKNGEDVMPITAEAMKCIKEIATEAADAIEELDKQLKEYHKYDSFLAVHGCFNDKNFIDCSL